VSVSTDLLAILACPSADHAPLRLVTSGSGEELVCTSCLSRFPVTDGIPVLLADEAVPGPRGLGVPATDEPVPDEPATEQPTGGDAPTAGPAGEPPGTTP
jgi:uncharacterized protein YbaR (Trm112 family)